MEVGRDRESELGGIGSSLMQLVFSTSIIKVSFLIFNKLVFLEKNTVQTFQPTNQIPNTPIMFKPRQIYIQVYKERD